MYLPELSTIKREISDMLSEIKKNGRVVTDTLPKIYKELKLANDLKVIELGQSENPAQIAMVAHVVEEARAVPVKKNVNSWRHKYYDEDMF